MTAAAGHSGMPLPQRLGRKDDEVPLLGAMSAGDIGGDFHA